MAVTKSVFGQMPTGEEVALFHLVNASGAWVEIIELGATLRGIGVKDRFGNLRDVLLGYDSVEEYRNGRGYFGAVIGPNGNRIGGSTFSIGDKVYVLKANEGPNNLHSGPEGFSHKLWKGEALGEDKVRFTYQAKDGESGFPGNRQVSVTYTWTDDCCIDLFYEGCSDQDTVFNMTNHAYFNLNGEGSGDVLSQKLQILARGMNPVGSSESIPTGKVAELEGTVFDFGDYHTIGERIEADDAQLKFTGGYDHNYVADQDWEPHKMRVIANAMSEESGITMQVCTDCPCVQFYAGNGVNHTGKAGKHYPKRGGFCLETQVEPNAVNVPSFHSPFYKAGEAYTSRTSYRFGLLGE